MKKIDRGQIRFREYSITLLQPVTDIILNVTSQADLMLTLLHIGSRLFELFSKDVRVKKQPGRPLKYEKAPFQSHYIIRIWIVATFD